MQKEALARTERGLPSRDSTLAAASDCQTRTRGADTDLRPFPMRYVQLRCSAVAEPSFPSLSGSNFDLQPDVPGRSPDLHLKRAGPHRPFLRLWTPILECRIIEFELHGLALAGLQFNSAESLEFVRRPVNLRMPIV